MEIVGGHLLREACNCLIEITVLVFQRGDALLDRFGVEVHEHGIIAKFGGDRVMSEAAAEFWRFSLAVYAQPGVAPACLVLQDEFGRDVNLALYCCWLGASGRGRLSRPALDAADRDIAPWRHQVVEHFRAARRAIKDAGAAGSESLYTKAKAIELEAERLLQSRLAERAPAADPSLSTQGRLDTAIANLTLYLGDAPADPIHAALRALAASNFVVVPA